MFFQEGGYMVKIKQPNGSVTKVSLKRIRGTLATDREWIA